MHTILINTFCLAWLYFAWAWPAPKQHAMRRPLARIRHLIGWAGLSHGWDMFQRPCRFLRRVEAAIVRESGAIVVWQAPRLDEFGFFAAFLGMRHRKFQYNLVEATIAKRDLVHYLWRLHDMSEDPVARIDLFVEDQPVQELELGETPPGRRYLTFTYRPRGEAKP